MSIYFVEIGARTVAEMCFGLLLFLFALRAIHSFFVLRTATKHSKSFVKILNASNQQ